MKHRRTDVSGATYFLTLSAADREGQVLLDPVNGLRQSFKRVRTRHPFEVDAIVVLPEHLRMPMTLPRDDADFATRIMLIKQSFSRQVPEGEWVTTSRSRRGERGLWQRRYWEHMIRDAADFERHVAYIHFNPVKQGWVEGAVDWPHSSIRRYMRQGLLDLGWAGAGGPAGGEFGE